MKKIILILSVVLAFTSCNTIHRTMNEPSSNVEFNKADFTFSKQITAEVTVVSQFGMEKGKTKPVKTGEFKGGSQAGGIPVIGGLLSSPVKGYAIYKLLEENKGYDVVFYPQFETQIEKPILGIGFLKKIERVKVTARLAKIK